MKKVTITLGLICLLMPLGVKAGSVNLSCNDTSVTMGSSTTCTLSGSSSEEVSALSAKLSSSGGVSISNVNVSSGWQGDGSGGSIDLYTDNNKSGGFGIATFTINVNGEGSVSVGGVTFSDANFTESSASGKTVNIGVKEEIKQDTNNNSNDNANSNSNNNNYIANNTNQTTTTTDNNKEKKSSDASLRELSLSNGTIDFNPNTLNYNVEVSSDIEKISINAVSNDSNASVKVPSDLSLQNGDNKFIVEVTAQDGTKKEYSINVVRLDKVLSTDSSLKSLDIAGYDIDFDTEKTVYDIGKIKTSSLKVYAVSTDSNATVRIHGNESIGEDDAIVIEVEAEDGSKTEYIVYVSNIAKEKQVSFKLLVLITFILLLISLGFNGFFIYKSYQNKNN